MLVINAEFKCFPGKREELLEKIKAEGIDTASRNEEGNLRYEFFLPAENPDNILLLEFWKDREAWLHHRTLPHYLRLNELKEVCVESTEALHSYPKED